MIDRLLYVRARDPEAASKGRWLNGLLLTFLALAAAQVVNALWANALTGMVISLGIMLLEGGLYLLNRRGYLGLATSGMLGLICVAVLGPPLGVPNISLTNALLQPPTFVLVVFLAGVFLSWRAVLILVILTSAVSAWYYQAAPIATLAEQRAANPAWGDTPALLTGLLLVAAGTLAWVSDRVIADTLARLRQRHADLEAAHRQLAKQARLRSEVEIARTIQERLLPATIPQLPGLEIAAVCHAARETSGDSYDLLVGPRGNLHVVVADACGKGVSAALLVALSRNSLRGALLRTDSPGQALGETNQVLVPDLGGRQFVATCCVTLAPRGGRAQIANAGQIYPALARPGPAGATCEFIETSLPRLPLGIVGGLVYPEIGVELCPGDLLVCCSDGLVDAAAPGGEHFGFDRFAAVLCAAATQGLSATATLASTLAAVHAWAGADSEQDDITVVVVRVQ